MDAYWCYHPLLPFFSVQQTTDRQKKMKSSNTLLVHEEGGEGDHHRQALMVGEEHPAVLRVKNHTIDALGAEEI
jgi:hypothetical protein